MKIERELLIKAAEELNEVMGLQPPINVEEDDNSIKAKIIKALEFREEEDEFSPEVEEIFAQLESEEDKDEDLNDEEELEEANEKIVKSGRKGKSKTNMLTRFAFVESLIEEGKYTRKEIVEKTLKEFPHTSKNTVQTILSSSKNPKYNKFRRLAVEDERGIISFMKGSSNKNKSKKDE